MEDWFVNVALSVNIALVLFLPLTALTYYFFRRKRRRAEIARVFEILNIDDSYKKAYEDESPLWYLIISVTYASLVAFLGLSVFYIDFSSIGSFKVGGYDFPREGSKIICGIAVFGAYMWGLNHVFQRFSVNDLYPGVFYRLSMRMFLAAIVAVITFNAFNKFEFGTDLNAWPVVAFMTGMFPRRGLSLLMDRIPAFSRETDPSIRKAPLEMIEGIKIHDRLRLEELGIDSCYDLASYDFIPLYLKTPYCARSLVSWILQAKLCAQFGYSVKELREQGIRTAVDIMCLSSDDIERLAADTSLTRSMLEQSRKSIMADKEDIERLLLSEHKLSRFSRD
jgi:hypothetical protein